MKKIKISKKLSLNKITVTSLDTVNTENVKGGAIEPKSDYVACDVKTKYDCTKYDCTGCLCETSIVRTCGKFC